MELKEIFEAATRELVRAKVKYPDSNSRYPWFYLRGSTGSEPLFSCCALVANEAAEASNAASKLVYNDIGSIEDMKTELIQTIATAIRVLEYLD